MDIDPALEGINDTRNGILLHIGFHNLVRTSKVAFLPVSFTCTYLSLHVAYMLD